MTKFEANRFLILGFLVSRGIPLYALIFHLDSFDCILQIFNRLK